MGGGVMGGVRIEQGGGDGFPGGIIAMWSGAVNAIPSGWALCDGSKGTPDLRGRFVVGAGGSYAVGTKGGAETVTLAVEQMPRHTHSLTNILQATLRAGDGAWVCPGYSTYGPFSITQGTGGDQPHENRPPYYALCYIMKV